MDLKTSNPPPQKLQNLHSFALQGVGVRKEKQRNLPMAKKDGAVTERSVVEAPSTPGRPVFSFSVVSRKNFPSKWDDAQKWLINGHESSPAADFTPKQCDGVVIKRGQTEVFSGESRLIQTKPVSLDHHGSDVLLKDKFTNEVEPTFPKFKCLESGFLFKNATNKATVETKHRDAGTEMTPTTSRCPTPMTSLSPPRHNTPASRSGPLALMDQSSSFDIGGLQEWHLAKLQPGTSNWSSREEEEEDVSKSLRHFEMSHECLKTISGPRPCAWEEKEQSKTCLRYQIAEAKIEAWVKLQSAKAEAESRKLEVKIEKMRSKFEEKLMRKMAVVDRKAEELRAAARVEHREAEAKKTMPGVHFSGNRGSCGCFILN